MEKLVEQFHALPHYGLMPKIGQDGKPGIGIRLEAGTLLLEIAGKEHHGSTEYVLYYQSQTTRILVELLWF